MGVGVNICVCMCLCMYVHHSIYLRQWIPGQLCVCVCNFHYSTVGRLFGRGLLINGINTGPANLQFSLKDKHESLPL